MEPKEEVSTIYTETSSSGDKTIDSVETPCAKCTLEIFLDSDLDASTQPFQIEIIEYSAKKFVLKDKSSYQLLLEI
jgi:hypothetical protein